MALSRLQGRQVALSLFRFPWSSSSSTTPIRHATGAYYVLLPEVPPDTSDDNAVMQYWQTPRFSVINPERCVTGCAKLSIQYETRLGNHIEDLQDISQEKTFSQVFDPIEEVTVPLNTAWRTAKNLNYVAGSNHYKQAFTRIHPQVERAKNERWISETLYYACKEVDANSANLTEFQQRLVSLYLLEGRLNGIELQGSEKRRFIDTLKVLALERTNFRNRVMLTQGMFSHRIDDFGAVAEMPRRILSHMAEDHLNPSRGPWRVTLQQNIYTPFLEHCSDRTLRWNAWNAYNNRASVNFNDRNLGNHKLIEELRNYRKDIAELLGYESFAEMSMETKMAGTVENVLNMIETLKGKFKPIAQEEIAELQQFAASEGFHDQLQMWDVAYWRRRHRDHLYKFDNDLVAEYFPLEHVLQGLFKLCNSLFGITVTECTGEVETWQGDVRYFKMSDDQGRHVGSFFFDSFSRPADKLGGSWMEMGRERSELMGTTPYSYLTLNLAPPVSPQSPVLMQFSDVLSLFHEFGHGLQQLMTKVPYSELAGQKNIEWDAVQVCARFMQCWLLEPPFLQSLSCHHQTGQRIPLPLLSQVLGAHRHFTALDTMRQLYLSAFDMEIYISKNHWHDAMTRVWAEYMPLPLSRDDNHPCSFTHIFSDQYPAAYYAYKWSEMIAADLFAAFKEQGLEDAGKMRELGGRFADTFLSMGGGVPASEVFRRFRGRDPSLDALQESLGVK
ncbi:uncharacterized protein LOC143275299 [Babylonia areolata]|uniref:uncharacterized protein LOC143275299 n=1 Tax=Babylonia areolata TaxID=304850 RepID=UPI003FD6BF82